MARYSVLNAGYWKRLEQGEITKAWLLPERFRDFFHREGIDFTDYDAFNAEYQWRLGAWWPFTTTATSSCGICGAR